MVHCSASVLQRSLLLSFVVATSCAESGNAPASEDPVTQLDAAAATAERSDRTAATSAAATSAGADSGKALDGSAPETKDAGDSGVEETPARTTPAERTDAGAPRAEDAAAPRAEDAATPDAATTAPDASTASEPKNRSCAPIDKIDLLLMIDNSNSMASEQTSLKNAFPGLIQALTSGQRFPGDAAPFPAIKDLHVGVVSSDMGIPGVELAPSCHADGGDDGRLRNRPSGDNCDPSYPTWLSFDGAAQGGAADITKFASDMQCIAGLGTGGCGFEQQLESPLKALSPKTFADAAGNQLFEPVRFISTTEPGTWGKGDVPAAQGGNLGFLRPDTDASPSLVVVVAVTDEDDCSVKSTAHLRPNNQLPDGDPLRMEDINLRCFLHPEFQYDLEERYYDGFRALRRGLEDRVLFAAIAGVPVDLVSPDALAKVDFEAGDPGSRKAFYDAILEDERMQQSIDPATMPGTGQGNLRTSCARVVPGESYPATAYPPRRIVEVAKQFDKNGIVQSICQDDFSGPTRAIIDLIARRLEQSCDAP